MDTQTWSRLGHGPCSIGGISKDANIREDMIHVILGAVITTAI